MWAKFSCFSGADKVTLKNQNQTKTKTNHHEKSSLPFYCCCVIFL
jgi:hypothetical protein